MTLIGIGMLGLAIALVVLLAIHPRCGLCHRLTRNGVRHYGGRYGMKGRFCGRCGWVVMALVGGVAALLVTMAVVR